MINILLVTHGDFGKELLKSSEIIMLQSFFLSDYQVSKYA